MVKKLVKKKEKTKKVSKKSQSTKTKSSKTVKLVEAKGRPMLNWVGKKTLEFVKSFPAQLVEIFEPENGIEIQDPKYDNLKKKWQNLLLHGDNLEVLGYLLANGYRGNIDLIYIDPPFDSGANYIRQVQLRGIKNVPRIEGEKYSVIEQTQYHDIWANDSYLQFMYERFLLLRELLSERGSIFVQCDWHKSHLIRCLLDEVFGDGGEDGKGPGFKSEIIWYFNLIGGNAKKFEKNHETVFWYTKSSEYTFNKDAVRQPYSEKFLKSLKPDEYGNITYSRGLGRDGAKLNRKATSAINPLGKSPADVWLDITTYNITGKESTAYPTQKPEKLVDRILQACSNPESLVLDCFVGSGTTAAVAQKSGRRWIGCDINKGAIQETSGRIQKIINEQMTYNEKGRQKTLDNSVEQTIKIVPFAHYKINDYDLQLLKTEAEELVIKHLGIEKNKTDLFFNGTRGKNLIKIIDFSHPLTILDLQLIQDEIKKRPEEDRNISVICLGKESSTDAWIEDHNKKHPVNKIEIIELRSDSKYGKFLIHKPPTAKVTIKRKNGKASIKLTNFISHSIVERLNEPGTLFDTKIDDFRSMINSILIDTDYNGSLFNIKFSDIPNKKSDLIQGTYEIDIPNKKCKIAIKITDMLGEEILITEEI